MSITSSERHHLHSRLTDVLGEHEADILMEHLPPVGWADVATKRDLDNLGVVLRSEMAALGAKIDLESANRRTDIERLASRMLREQHIQLTVMVAAISALAAVLTIFG